jgi:hypothetical protein
MINVRRKKCQGCNTIPSYNYKGQSPMYCTKHKKEGMIMSDPSKICRYKGCTTRSNFNYEGNSPKYCVKHKREGMIDVRSERCQYEGCSNQPSFNYEGESPKYCSKHKEKGMINVKCKKCQYENCCKCPSYNYEGGEPKYCVEHKEEKMIYVSHEVCSVEKCNSQANYGIIGNKPYHCAIHADRRVEIFRPMRRCFRCNELATYGDEYPIRCESHALSEDKDFETSRCSKCGLQSIINRKNVCYYCDEEKHVRLAKQDETVAYLRMQNIPIESVDKIIDTECGLERPDIVINSSNGLFKIVVEVDEGQHKSYPELCECVRMKNIAEVFQLPTLYIRFNPDEYKTPDLEEFPMKKRLMRLKMVVEKYMNMETLEFTIGVIQLYFDGWIENNPTGITVIKQ